MNSLLACHRPSVNRPSVNYSLINSGAGSLSGRQDYYREVGLWQGFSEGANLFRVRRPIRNAIHPDNTRFPHKAKPLGGQPPRARKPLPQSSALRLCRPPLALRPFHFALLRYKGGETPQLALATPRLRQVAFRHLVEMPTTKTKARSERHDHQHRPHAGTHRQNQRIHHRTLRRD